MCIDDAMDALMMSLASALVLMTSRARFCISAAHTRKELDVALGKIEEVCTLLKLRYRQSSLG